MKTQGLGQSERFQVLDETLRLAAEILVGELDKRNVGRVFKCLLHRNGAVACWFRVAHHAVIKAVFAVAGLDAVGWRKFGFFEQRNHGGQLERGTRIGAPLLPHRVIVVFGIPPVGQPPQVCHRLDFAGCHFHHHHAAVAGLVACQCPQQRTFGHVLYIDVEGGLDVKPLLRADFIGIAHAFPRPARHPAEQPASVLSGQLLVVAEFQSGSPALVVQKADGPGSQRLEWQVAAVEPLKNHPALAAAQPENGPLFHEFLVLVANQLVVDDQVLPFAPAIGTGFLVEPADVLDFAAVFVGRTVAEIA